MVTIARFDTLEEAYLLRMRLESEGIAAHIFNENTVQMNWLLCYAVGGVKLQVEDEDYGEALRVINEPVDNVVIDSSGGYVGEMTPERAGKVCPQCGSLDIRRSILGRAAAYLGVLFFRVPLPFNANLWHCGACKYEGKPRAFMPE